MFYHLPTFFLGPMSLISFFSISCFKAAKSIYNTLIREESVCGRKCLQKEKLWNLLLRSGPQKNLEKLEFITAIWTNKWEIKEFITAMEYLR